MEPLSSKIRPQSLKDFIGQEKLIGKNGPIRKFIENGKIPSMIFWGPPGVGKTTLAVIISKTLNFDFFRISAVMAKKEDLRKILIKAFNSQKTGKETILFIDEIHRWSKSQQDALLPYVEKGIITLIGATTENPSFTIIPALLSRMKVFTFERIPDQLIFEKLKKVQSEYFINIDFSQEAIETLSNFANGDLRQAIDGLEICAKNSVNGKVVKEDVENFFQKILLYDRKYEEHYNLISALHKSMRASDVNASIYWTMRILESGEDPLFIARRMIRFASEDIGNSDPNALILANSVFEVCQKIGVPECDCALVQLAIYLAKAPKDNSCYIATIKAREDIKKFGNLPVPLHLRNAATKLMKDLGYGEGYIYDHNLKSKKSGQKCLPDEILDRKYT